MRGPLIRVSQAAADELKHLAEAKGITVVAVVDELLRPAPRRPDPIGPIAGTTLEGGLVDRQGIPIEPTCRGCGHLTRKHTPACYELGCHCRKLRA